MPIKSFYGKAALKIVEKLKMDTEDLLEATRLAESELMVVDSLINDIDQKIALMKKDIKKLQEDLKHQISMQWPQLINPYSDTFVDFFTSHKFVRLRDWLEVSDDYRVLEKTQKALEQADIELLERRRERATFLKLRWMVNMSHLQVQFVNYATSDEKSVYEKLVKCENWVPSLEFQKPNPPVSKCNQ